MKKYYLSKKFFKSKKEQKIIKNREGQSSAWSESVWKHRKGDYRQMTFMEVAGIRTALQYRRGH